MTAKVDSKNVFDLIINEDDPILARYEYLLIYLEEYEGEYVDNCLNRLRESMFWYAYAFDVDPETIPE
jgi:hypothetical protein